jgi:hypothetical protein
VSLAASRPHQALTTVEILEQLESLRVRLSLCKVPAMRAKVIAEQCDPLLEELRRRMDVRSG